MYAAISAHLFAQKTKSLRSNNQQASADDRGAGPNKPRAFAASRGLRAFRMIKEVAKALGFIAALATAPTLAVAATSPGTIISNTAQLQFTHPGFSSVETVNSNTITATVVPVPTKSTLSVLRFTDAATATQNSTAGPTQCFRGGAFGNLSQPYRCRGDCA